MLHTVANTKPLLGYGQGVHVVVDVDRKVDVVLKRSYQVDLVPIQGRRIVTDTRAGVYYPIEADADPHDLGARNARCIASIFDRPAKGPHRCVWILQALHRD